jgi:hypothetical protein
MVLTADIAIQVAKPLAKIPQSRKACNSSVTKLDRVRP